MAGSTEDELVLHRSALPSRAVCETLVGVVQPSLPRTEAHGSVGEDHPERHEDGIAE